MKRLWYVCNSDLNDLFIFCLSILARLSLCTMVGIVTGDSPFHRLGYMSQNNVRTISFTTAFTFFFSCIFLKSIYHASQGSQSRVKSSISEDILQILGPLSFHFICYHRKIVSHSSSFIFSAVK